MMRFPFFLSLCLTLFTAAFTAFADDANVQNVFNEQIKAQDAYYQAVKNLKDPTPNQIQELNNSILGTATMNFKQALENRQKENDDKARKENEVKQSSNIKKLNDIMDQKLEKESDREKAREAFRKALKGDFTGIKFKKGNLGSSGSPGPSKITTSIPVAPPREEIKLDGSKIPRQIEFPGKKSQKIQPLSQPTPRVVPFSQ